MQPHRPQSSTPTMRGAKEEVHVRTLVDQPTRRRRTSVYPCPRCGSRLFRMHRRLSDRLLSTIAPVRRYSCTNIECEYECTIPKRHSSGHHRVLGIPGVVGVTLAVALTLGISLWIAHDKDEKSIRTKVQEARTSLRQYQETRLRNGMASAQLPIPDFNYEPAVIIDVLSDVDPSRTTIDFAPPLSDVTPAADGRIQTPGAR